MWRGLYTAAAGMMTQENRTGVIANNLANANTTGYKRDRALDAEFRPMLIRRINDDMPIKVTDFKGFSLDRRPPAVGTLGLGSYTDEIAVDHAPGNFMTTGNPLDLAISGNGFFVIDTPEGPRYTRNGNFYRAVNGDLVNSDGRAVLLLTGQALPWEHLIRRPAPLSLFRATWQRHAQLSRQPRGVHVCAWAVLPRALFPAGRSQAAPACCFLL